MSQSPFSPQGFGGQARLFPLPNLVLFPHVTQPLHIFELRYRQLMADALADDRLIAMALLRPGWEEDYHMKPPIHSVVCLGRIHREVRLADGRYNFLLEGLCRARIREELNADRLYRLARVALLEEEPVSSEACEQELRQRLIQRVIPFFAPYPAALDQVERLVQSELPLGTLCDVFCFALPLEMEAKQSLLEELSVERRIPLLLDNLPRRQPNPPSEPTRRFPPGFSAN